jgi:hypothetical protein
MCVQAPEHDGQHGHGLRGVMIGDLIRLFAQEWVGCTIRGISGGEDLAHLMTGGASFEFFC